jgi:DNA polymerase V
MKNQIGLLDCNNFFVSCERLFRPDLKGQPVLVLSSNDGCVVARSQEVKDIGIPMGVPYFKIKDILRTNDVAVFSGNPALYRDLSRRVFSSMSSVVGPIDKYSIDEAFFSVNESDSRKLAALVKDTVEREVGMPVSVGVGASRTLAKLANDTAKRTNGVSIIDKDNWRKVVISTELSAVWGIGAAMSKRFKEHGLRTVLDFISLEDRQVTKLFGVVGSRLKSELLGGFLYESVEESQRKSLMSTRTLRNETTDIRVLRAALTYHVNYVADQLRSLQLKASHLKIFISPSRFSDFALQNKAAEVDFTKPTNQTGTLLKSALMLLDRVYVDDVPYKKVGVLTNNLIPADVEQMALFGNIEEAKMEGLQTAIDDINKVALGGKIRVGMVAQDDAAKPRSDLRSPSYTTKWNDLATVKA